MDSINYRDHLDETDKKSIDYISQASDRMRMLIRGLLEYSKLGRNVEFKKVDCNLILETVQSNLAKTIKDTKTKIEIGRLPKLKGHEVKLTLLFQNLISNSIKFRKENRNPLIQVSAEMVKMEKRKKWRFRVEDNGIGISKKHQEKVFDIFHREHGKSKYEGTGIGLAHCKKIVEIHGGKIWVESEHGKGTIFFFTI